MWNAAADHCAVSSRPVVPNADADTGSANTLLGTCCLVAVVRYK